MVKGKNIVITGGCGFVGGSIAERLSLSNNVTVVDNMRYWKGIPYDKILPARCGFTEYDFDKLNDDFYNSFDLIIHAATVNIIHGMENPLYCMKVNFEDTVLTFDGVKDSIPILYLSTSSVYGNAVNYPTSETCRVAPDNAYAMSKLLAEQVLLKNHEKTMVLRLSNVYGPRQRPENAYSGVMVRLLESMITGKEFSVIGDGTQTRDYTYVDDVVSAVECALKSGHYGEIYNVGTGVETSILDLTQRLSDPSKIKLIPKRSIDSITRRCLDSRKLMIHTGWKPAFSLDEGIKNTVAWLTEQNIFSTP